MIQKSYLGRIFGPGGRFVAKIEELSGARTFHQPDYPFAEFEMDPTYENLIRISGSPNQVAVAIDLMEKALADLPNLNLNPISLLSFFSPFFFIKKSKVTTPQVLLRRWLRLENFSMFL